MRIKRFGAGSFFVIISAGAVLAAWPAPRAGAVSTPLPGVYGGGADAASLNVSVSGVSVAVDHLAHIGCPCQGTGGVTRSVQTGPVSVPGVISAQATTATTRTGKTAKSANNNDTSSITQLSLLGGMITANAIDAVADVAATQDALSTSSAGSSFVSLVVAGQTIPSTVAPNTVVALPGVGSVTIYGVTTKGGKNKASIVVDMLVINVTESNSFNLPVGAVLKIGEASASYNRTQPAAVVGGFAYIANVNPQGQTLLPELHNLQHVAVGDCTGTDGATHTKSFAGISELIASLGAGTVTAFGGPIGDGKTQAQTTANVTNVDLLLGAISADAVTSEATETAKGLTVTGSTAGTQFASLSVEGSAVPANVPPNTTITLPLLGKVVINEQIVGGSGRQGHTEVTALHVYIDQTNTLNLPVGSEITVARARASAIALK